jgi:hypothetical protein
MKRAGLPLSVGQAPLAVRVVIASVFALSSAVSIGGGIAISSIAAARVVAVLLVVPTGLVGVLAVAFILAPRSRYGDWLDRFVPRLRDPRVAAGTAMLLWSLAFLMTWMR